MNNKEELQAFISRYGVLLEDESLDLYWDYYMAIPLNGSITPRGDEYRLANDLFEWHLIARISEPVFNNTGSFIGRQHHYYRVR